MVEALCVELPLFEVTLEEDLEVLVAPETALLLEVESDLKALRLSSCGRRSSRPGGR